MGKLVTARKRRASIGRAEEAEEKNGGFRFTSDSIAKAGYFWDFVSEMTELVNGESTF